MLLRSLRHDGQSTLAYATEKIAKHLPANLEFSMSKERLSHLPNVSVRVVATNAPRYVLTQSPTDTKKPYVFKDPLKSPSQLPAKRKKEELARKHLKDDSDGRDFSSDAILA
jgi:CCR4-NOT transcriptional regulation complex NOT5 subunit